MPKRGRKRPRKKRPPAKQFDPRRKGRHDAAADRTSPTGVTSHGALALFGFTLPTRPCGCATMPGSWGLLEKGWGELVSKNVLYPFFMLKVSITPAAVPKRINFIPVSLPRGRNSPECGKSGSIAVNAGASALTQFNWPYRYSMLRRFACMAFLSNDWTISPINSLPLTILAWMIRSFGVSCVARHRLKMAWTLPSLRLNG